MTMQAEQLIGVRVTEVDEDAIATEMKVADLPEKRKALAMAAARSVVVSALERGVSQDQVDQMMRANPRTFFERS